MFERKKLGHLCKYPHPRFPKYRVVSSIPIYASYPNLYLGIIGSSHKITYMGLIMCPFSGIDHCLWEKSTESL